MFDFVLVAKRATAAVAATWAAGWPIIVGLAEKLNLDVSAGKAAVLAALAASGAAILAAAGNLFTQWRERASDLLGLREPLADVVDLLVTAQESIEEAKRKL